MQQSEIHCFNSIPGNVAGLKSNTISEILGHYLEVYPSFQMINVGGWHKRSLRATIGGGGLGSRYAQHRRGAIKNQIVHQQIYLQREL